MFIIFVMSNKGDNKQGNYAVASGRETGVFNTWAEAKSNVEGYSNNQNQKFSNATDAQNFVNGRR